MNQIKCALELNRKHLVAAFISYCRNRSGGKAVVRLVVKRKFIEIAGITNDVISNCLIRGFEATCIEQFKGPSALELLSETYSGFLSCDNGKLTPDGVDFMNELMKEVIIEALNKPKKNRYGLRFGDGEQATFNTSADKVDDEKRS